MKKIFLFVSLSVFVAHPGLAADTILDEIKVNLEDAQKKLDQARKQIGDLEENDAKIKKNVKELDTALDKKLSEQKTAKEVHNDYSQKLASTGSAKKEFERSLLKDRQEMELVDRDLQIVEKKLASLKAVRDKLEESIEISEDNLSKMNDRLESWQKNKDHIQGELSGLDKDIVKLETQKDAQEKSRLENQESLNKWKRQLAAYENAYQKFDSKYRQALRDAEKKAKGH